MCQDDEGCILPIISPNASQNKIEPRRSDGRRASLRRRSFLMEVGKEICRS